MKAKPAKVSGPLLGYFAFCAMEYRRKSKTFARSSS